MRRSTGACELDGTVACSVSCHTLDGTIACSVPCHTLDGTVARSGPWGGGDDLTRPKENYKKGYGHLDQL